MSELNQETEEAAWRRGRSACFAVQVVPQYMFHEGL